MDKTHHYVGAVPAWLTETLAQINAPTSTAASLSKVAELLSVDDACNYLHYLMNRCSVGETFADMPTLTEMPENVTWINTNAEAISKTKAAFDSALKKAEKDMESEDLPLLVRKVPTTPIAVDSNVLLLVGSVAINKIPRIQFLRNCIDCLNTQVLFDDYKRYIVFKEYTKAV